MKHTSTLSCRNAEILYCKARGACGIIRDLNYGKTRQVTEFFFNFK
jgi:hypothetical protein